MYALAIFSFVLTLAKQRKVKLYSLKLNELCRETFAVNLSYKVTHGEVPLNGILNKSGF